MEIHSYKPEYAPAFDRLNRAWIEQYFWVEPFDNEVLTKPDQYILNQGGELWFAVENGEAMGACALIKLRDDLFEFTKLGVDEKARGKGVARALLRHCIARARAMKKAGVKHIDVAVIAVADPRTHDGEV
jgi:N-acetylglutamate synthase-like GNAT family acetyltransferase